MVCENANWPCFAHPRKQKAGLVFQCLESLRRHFGEEIFQFFCATIESEFLSIKALSHPIRSLGSLTLILTFR